MRTKYGKIDIANSEAFSAHRSGFRMSPFLQEKLLYLGQEGTYEEASEATKHLLGLEVSPTQIYRLVHHYGQSIEADLQQTVVESDPAQKPLVNEVVYAMVDGAMILTDVGYKENKLGRIFSSNHLVTSSVENRGGHIESSLYTSHLGTSDDFIVKIKAHMDAHRPLGRNLVFISDGAIWLRQMVEENYPQATMILDFYHVMEYVGTLGVAALGNGKRTSEWIESQRQLLLDSQVDRVLNNLKNLQKTAPELDDNLYQRTHNYLDSNRDRMDYKSYRNRELLIGSGAIESAHRTVVQKRCKRSGQRWTTSGAQRVLNLRTCWMSNRWEMLRNHIEPYQSMAA